MALTLAVQGRITPTQIFCGTVNPAQIPLFAKGIDPDNRLCKWCMRKVVAHLTKRAVDADNPKTGIIIQRRGARGGRCKIVHNVSAKSG